MSLNILAQGQLTRDPERRTSKAGRQFVTCQLRVTAEDENLFLSVIAFDEAVCGKLARLKKGDAVAVSGRAKPVSWVGTDGEQRRGLSVVAAGALTAYELKKRRGADERKQAPAGDDWGVPESSLDDIGAA